MKCCAWLQVLANFGNSEYVSDVRGLREDAAKQVQTQVQAVPVPAKGKVCASLLNMWLTAKLAE